MYFIQPNAAKVLFQCVITVKQLLVRFYIHFCT